MPKTAEAYIKTIAKFFFIVQIALLSACDPTQYYEFHNRSGQDALFLLRRGSDPKYSAENYVYVKQDDTKRLVRQLSASNELDIVYPDHTWKYRGITYHAIGIFPCSTNHLVVMPDGGLYNFRFRGNVPDTIGPDTRQPRGYPCYPIIIPRGLSGESKNQEVGL